MSEIELKPCPFCGAAPEFAKDDGNSTGIFCEYWECDVQPNVYSGISEAPFADIAKMWNTRAKSGADVDRLKLVALLEEKNKLVTAEIRELRAENERLRKLTETAKPKVLFVKHYRTLEANTLPELEKAIQNAAVDGWMLRGETTLQVTLDGKRTYTQEMILSS